MMYQLSIETKGRYNMILRQLYAKTFSWVKINLILSDTGELVYEGDFDEFPFMYADYIVDTIGVVDNILLVYIYG